MAIVGHEIGGALIKAIGLPKQTVSFVLRVESGRIVTVECEYYPDGAHDIVTALAEYELVPRIVSPPDVSMHRADVIGFDAWMRERVEAAHQVMMSNVYIDTPQNNRHAATWSISARDPREIADDLAAIGIRECGAML